MELKEAGVNQICRLLNLSKDTYYNSKDPKEILKDKYAPLKPKLEKIIEENQAYGYRRIKKAILDEYSASINHKLLLKLLKIWNLSLKRKIRKKKKSVTEKILAFLQSRANLLRKAKVTGCFQAIVSDITAIKYQGGIAYLCVHLDYFGKMVYGFKLSVNPNSDLVIDSLKKAKHTLKRKFKLRNLKDIIFHQDRGSVYTGYKNTREILKDNSLLSYSKKGEPGDNATNEAFFSRLKEEKRDEFYEAKSFEELERMVKEAIKYYNCKRYHTSINLTTPLKYTKQAAKTYLTKKAAQVVW